MTAPRPQPGTAPAQPPIALAGRDINLAVDELAGIDRWVLWKLERSKAGKPTKVPYCVGGRRKAKSTDRSTWDSFNACWISAFVNGAADGIGFVLDGSDDIMAADLDDCRGEDGTIAPWAREIVDLLDSYSEVSPSGTGLRVFFRGTMPDKGRKVGRLELYRDGRFLTITGAHLPGMPETINEVAPEIIASLIGPPRAKPNGPDEGLDWSAATRATAYEDLPEALRQRFGESLRRNAKLRARWEGEPPGGSDQSRSAWDLSLARLMRSYGRDSLGATGERFTLEDFAAVAWVWPQGKGQDGDARHLRRCWERAGEEPDDPQPGGPALISSLDLMATAFPPAKWIVPNLLCEGLSLLAGKPKLGKSWLILQRAIAVATGGLVLGFYPCEPGAVLVLSLEDSKRRLQDRFRKLNFAGHPNLTVAVEWPRLNEGAIEAVERWLDQHPGGRLVEVDTLAKIRAAGIANKDAYQADSDALRGLHRVANDRNIAVNVVHHLRKTPAEDWVDEISGTAGIGGVPDAITVLKRERGQADAFMLGTGRDVPDFEIALKFDEGTCCWRKLDISVAQARATSEQTAIIEALRAAAPAGLMRHQIAAMTGRSKEGTSHMLRRMEDAGIVERKDSFWRLTC